ncbi:hypothetical protein Taro_053205 [Colocasia esculenta]|uniref:Sulfotransferase n=1 Tax=Colocasia esculenta TaxID=4460 RepID=A0A843XKL2_COLES|nr:hypothetical protein [Colocasia esculenta]
MTYVQSGRGGKPCPRRGRTHIFLTHWLPCRLYGGFWVFEDWLPGTIAAQQHMVSRDDDVLVTALPKSGVTWLKSLVFAVVRCGTHPPADPTHPLRRTNPHDCVEFLEEIYAQNREVDLEALLSPPRILSIHTPYSVLTKIEVVNPLTEESGMACSIPVPEQRPPSLRK